MNEQLLMKVLIAMAIPLVLALVVRGSLHREAESHGEGMTVFRGSRFTTFVALTSITLSSAYAMVVPFLPREDWFISLCLLAIVVVMSFQVPPVLTIDDGGISSHVWFSWKRVEWGEVSRLELQRAFERKLLVATSDNRKIVCSGSHVGCGEFYRAVLARTRLPLRVVTAETWTVSKVVLPNAEALRLRLL